MATPPSPPKKRTLYDILGVPRDAGAIDIGLAYKARVEAMKRDPGADPNEANLVHEAYHVLCMPNERAAYDAKLVTMAEREAAKAAVASGTDLPLEDETEKPPVWQSKWGITGAVLVVILVGWYAMRPKDPPAPRIVAQRELRPPVETAGTGSPGAVMATPAIARTGEELFAELSKSIARITVHDMSGRAVGIGSGVVTDRGTIVTNCHVTSVGGSIAVKLGAEQYSASVEVADEEYDLCRLSVPGLNAPAVKLGTVDSLKTGQKVFAIGSPQGMDLTISDGIVSSLRDLPQGRIVQTTAPISPGSSGGGLFDAYGNLVGIVTFQHRTGQNLNFAVPADWIPQMRSRSATNPLLEAMGRASAGN